MRVHKYRKKLSSEKSIVWECARANGGTKTDLKGKGDREPRPKVRTRDTRKSPPCLERVAISTKEKKTTIGHGNTKKRSRPAL